MKAELINSEFKPIEVKLTFETRKEFEAFYALISYTSAVDKSELVNKTVKLDGHCYIFTIKGLKSEDFIPMEKICGALSKFEKKGSYEE